MVAVKRVYDPAGPEDGLRILCTSLWPRGVKKTAVDRWLRELGTPTDLLRPYLDGKISREEFRTAMRGALANPAAQAGLDELADLVRQGRQVTLLTSVRDLDCSHLWVIVDELRERLGPDAL